MYEVHSTAGVDAFYIIANIGAILWLWSMYVYIPINYPTRMRSLGTGWTDGVGHLGAWGGVLIAGALYSATNPQPFVLFITIPCALVPGILIAIFGKNQRQRALEETVPIDAGPPAGLSGRRLFPEVSPAAKAGCHRRPSLTTAGLPS